MSRLTAFFLVAMTLAVHAVEIDTDGTITYNTLVPSDAGNPSGAVAGWDSGWGTDSGGTVRTGWDYVGQVNGASAIYLGNGWVLTAAHVGPGDFSLQIGSGSTVTYSLVSGSVQTITNPGSSPATSPDLSLFQVTNAGGLPDLPPLTLANSTLVGSSVVMTGYGGGQGRTWGENTVTATNINVTLEGYDYVSRDFATAYTGTGFGNNAILVLFDSGGGDFIYDSVHNQWDLAGVNEAVDTDNNSYMVQLSRYASQINAITGVPEPSTWALLGVGLVGLAVAARRGNSTTFKG